MLEPFMLQVCKIKGGLYLMETLQDIFRKFGAIIRRAQEVRIGITGIEVPFDIRYSPIFCNARKACIASMNFPERLPRVSSLFDMGAEIHVSSLYEIRNG